MDEYDSMIKCQYCSRDLTTIGMNSFNRMQHVESCKSRIIKKLNITDNQPRISNFLLKTSTPKKRAHAQIDQDSHVSKSLTDEFEKRYCNGFKAYSGFSIYTQFPWQLLHFFENRTWIVDAEQQSFHTKQCHANHYLLEANENKVSHSCSQLQYSKQIRKIVECSTKVEIDKNELVHLESLDLKESNNAAQLGLNNESEHQYCNGYKAYGDVCMYRNFPWQLLFYTKNRTWTVDAERQSFHTKQCRKNHYLLQANENKVSHSCSQLQYNKQIRKIVKNSLLTVTKGLNSNQMSHEQQVNELNEINKEFFMLELESLSLKRKFNLLSVECKYLDSFVHIGDNLLTMANVKAVGRVSAVLFRINKIQYQNEFVPYLYLESHNLNEVVYFGSVLVIDSIDENKSNVIWSKVYGDELIVNSKCCLKCPDVNTDNTHFSIESLQASIDYFNNKFYNDEKLKNNLISINSPFEKCNIVASLFQLNL